MSDAHPDLSLRQTIASMGAYVRPLRGAIVLGCGLLVVAGGLSLAQPLAARWMLDLLARGSGVRGALTLLTALVLGGAVMLGFGSFLLMRSAEGVVHAGRRTLVRHILALSLPGMRRQAPGDLVARVTADTTLLRQIAIQSLVQALIGLVMLVGALVLMAIVDVVLLVTTVGVIAILAAAVWVVMPRIRRASRRAQRAVGEMGGALERSLGAFTTVKAFGGEPVETARVERAAAAAYDQGVVLAKWSSVAGTAVGLSMQVAFLVVLGVGGARVTNGVIDVSDLVAFLLYVLYLSQPLLQLVNAGTYFQAGRAAINRISEVTALPTEPLAADRPASVPIAPTDGGSLASPEPASVVLEGVSFTYPDRKSPALRGCSVIVPPRGLTALVGPSGAGKTTVFKLVERFYEPDGGRILLDGRDLRSWDMVDLRATIAYVEQDAPVMAGTLRENLAYGAPGANDEELRAALAVTRLGPMLERLGGDLDAEVQHRGASLSGGERQRVAIARALLRRPRLLLLDEATSQLDAVNEAALRGVIEDLAGRTTVMVVAHRLSTVQSAERIAVMSDGAVTAVGRHQELVLQDGLYAELTTHQLLRGGEERQRVGASRRV